MTRTAWVPWCLAGCLLFAAPAFASTARAAGIDASRSQIGFTLRTRWGQVLEGRFPEFHGDIELLPDGRRRVRLSLAARDIEIVGRPGYSRLTRGEGFFDAERFPEVSFVSQPYPEQLTRTGGLLAGDLRIRDVVRRQAFVIAPSACARPGLDCDVVARGDVRRSAYGMDRWSFALADEVGFSLRIRTQGGLP